MPDARPNVIYFVCHDLGRELGCYGRDVATPVLDRFAEAGVRFDRAFCSSPCCSPSRGCAMSGQYAHTNGLMGLVNGGWSMPASTLTVVDHLNEAGYETAHFGLQHERSPVELNRYQIEGAGPVSAEDAISAAVRYLEECASITKPFYLNIGTGETHESRWNSADRAGRVSVYRPGPPEEAYVPPFLPDVPRIRREMAHFQAAVRFLDSEIGRLFEAIARLGLEEKTLVVFTTDHGISGARSKGWLYDAGVSTALLMRMPGTIPGGTEVGHLIQNIDLTPTILEAAGTEIPEGVQGRSFWPLLTGGDYTPHEAIFTERNYHGSAMMGKPLPPPEEHPGYDPMRAVRTPRYHYIRNLGADRKEAWIPEEVPEFGESFDKWYGQLWPKATKPRSREELFCLAEDPNEVRNVAGDPGCASIKSDLAALVDRWMAETDDPILRGPIPDRLNPHGS